MLRHLAAALALGCVAAAGAAGQDQPWKLKDLGRLDGLVDLHAVPGSDVIVATTAAGAVGLRFGPDGSFRRVGVPRQPTPPPDLLPHSRCAVGAANIRLACLTSPTEGYDHGVLGDAVEAKALSVRRGDGTWSRHRLAGDAVFEDLTPRLADLDGDGSDEVMVVKAKPGEGAALAVLGLDGPHLRPRSESRPIGLSYRWLNPVGAGDFDGDGRVEIAVVRTPHIGGIVMIYQPDGPRLVVEGRLRGFSNHRMGSTALGLARSQISTATVWSTSCCRDRTVPGLPSCPMRAAPSGRLVPPRWMALWTPPWCWSTATAMAGWMWCSDLPMAVLLR